MDRSVWAADMTGSRGDMGLEVTEAEMVWGRSLCYGAEMVWG